MRRAWLYQYDQQLPTRLALLVILQLAMCATLRYSFAWIGVVGTCTQIWIYSINLRLELINK